MEHKSYLVGVRAIMALAVIPPRQSSVSLRCIPVKKTTIPSTIPIIFFIVGTRAIAAPMVIPPRQNSVSLRRTPTKKVTAPITIPIIIFIFFSCVCFVFVCA